MACHFPLLHSCGTHEKSAMDCSRTQVEREMKAMTPVEATRRCAGEKGCPDICPLLHRARKSPGRSSSSTGKSAIIEGEGWQGERSSLVVGLSPQQAWTRLEQTQHRGGERDEPGKSAAIRWHVTSSNFLFGCSWGFTCDQ